MTVLPKDRFRLEWVVALLIFAAVFCFHEVPLMGERESYKGALELYRRGQILREPYMSRIVDGKVQTAYTYYTREGCKVFPLGGGTWSDAYWEDGDE